MATESTCSPKLEAYVTDVKNCQAYCQAAGALWPPRGGVTIVDELIAQCRNHLLPASGAFGENLHEDSLKTSLDFCNTFKRGAITEASSHVEEKDGAYQGGSAEECNLSVALAKMHGTCAKEGAVGGGPCVGQTWVCLEPNESDEYRCRSVPNSCRTDPDGNSSCSLMIGDTFYSSERECTSVCATLPDTLASLASGPDYDNRSPPLYSAAADQSTVFCALVQEGAKCVEILPGTTRPVGSVCDTTRQACRVQLQKRLSDGKDTSVWTSPFRENPNQGWSLGFNL